jgi:sec-independent protein translocase protein TatA
MFGIGGGEFIFIILIILMFFGSDKIPEMARGLAKGIAQLKNATNDIKSEISKSVESSGIDPNALTGGISAEIAKAKEGFSKMVNDSADVSSVKTELGHIGEVFTGAVDPKPVTLPESTESISPQEDIPDGPIKRTRP